MTHGSVTPIVTATHAERHADALGVVLLVGDAHADLVSVALDALEERAELPRGVYVTPHVDGHPRALVTVEACVAVRQMAPPGRRRRYGWSAAPHVWPPAGDVRPPWSRRLVSEWVTEWRHPIGLAGAWDVRGGGGQSVVRRCIEEVRARLLSLPSGWTDDHERL